MGKILLKQRPADTITIVFLLFLTGLTLVFHSKIPGASLLLTLYTVLIIVQIITIRVKIHGRFAGFLHDLLFPVIAVILIFDSLEWIVHNVNPRDIDPVLIRLDYWMFGNHPTVALERIMNPLLTDFLQAAYSTYYFIPVSFGIVLLLDRKREEFNKALFMILFCFYLSYLGYILFPALGPRFTISHLQTSELQGVLLTEPIQNLLNRLEGIKRDAFPSGHTGVAVTVLYLAYKYKRGLFRIYLPVVTALIFSTVYCRYHYVVDVIAGFGLTLITVLAGEWYYSWWSAKYAKTD